MIIDTQKWNKYNITQKLLNALISNPSKFTLLDQDALNLILQKQIKYINKKYNYHSTNKISAKDDIALLHFVHIPKPWHLSWYYSHSINPYNKYLYKNFEDLTPWKGLPFRLPISYKEMRYHSMYLREHKHFSGALYWQIKYLITKIKYLLKK